MIYNIKIIPTESINNTLGTNNISTSLTTEQTNGNAVLSPQTETTPITRSYTIAEKIPQNTTRRSTSLYTSQGKRKARPADAITRKEDILRLKNFFLYESANDRKAFLRTRNHLLFVLGISSSLRVGDLINLDIGQVLTRTVTTNPETNCKEYHYSIKDHIELIDTKTRKSNLIKVNSEARNALKLYFTEYIKICNERGLPIEASHPLFQTEGSLKNMENTGKPSRLHNDGVYAILDKAQKKLNLPYHLSTHCLRKTFAYWTLELHPNDANAIAVLMKALNHSSLEATNHYTGRTQAQRDIVFDDISAVFDSDTTVEDNYTSVNNIVTNNTTDDIIENTVDIEDPTTDTSDILVNTLFEDNAAIDNKNTDNEDTIVVPVPKTMNTNTHIAVHTEVNTDTSVSSNVSTEEYMSPELQNALKTINSLSDKDRDNLLELVELLKISNVNS